MRSKSGASKILFFVLVVAVGTFEVPFQCLNRLGDHSNASPKPGQEYHYVWSVSDPFLPRCFKLPPSQLKLHNATGALAANALTGSREAHKDRDCWAARTGGLLEVIS